MTSIEIDCGNRRATGFISLRRAHAQSGFVDSRSNARLGYERETDLRLLADAVIGLAGDAEEVCRSRGRTVE